MTVISELWKGQNISLTSLFTPLKKKIIPLDMVDIKVFEKNYHQIQEETLFKKIFDPKGVRSRSLEVANSFHYISKFCQVSWVFLSAIDLIFSVNIDLWSVIWNTAIKKRIFQKRHSKSVRRKVLAGNWVFCKEIIMYFL